MGRRGPKPAPAAVRLAKGNPGRRPVGDDPQVTADVGAGGAAGDAVDLCAVEGGGVGGGAGRDGAVAPDWLTDEARGVWDRLAPRLMPMKLLMPADAETFARYCWNFAFWLKNRQRLDEGGAIYEIETQSGLVRRCDPAFMICDRLDKALERAEASFGLNPAERQRIFAQRAAVAAAPELFPNAAAGDGRSATTVSTLSDAPASGASGSPVGLLN